MGKNNNSEEMDLIVNTLKKQGKMEFFEGATLEEISLYEKEHKISFPQKFKEWLLYSDGGDLFLPAGAQIYGIAHKPLLNVNDDDRPNDSYIVIGALSTGDPILCEKNGNRVAVYNHEAGKIEDDEIYEDFFAFLKDLYELLGIGE